jgi:ubiquinone biosynthesis protein
MGQNFFRIFHIVWITRRYFSLFNLKPKRRYTRGEACRLLLENLGPIFVKLGQMLSMRPDIIPKDIVDELVKLQDQVPPFSQKLLKSRLKEFEQLKHFQHIEHTPLACASIAQVHAVILPNGEKGVIKLLRPHIKKIIQRDISLMYFMLKFGGKYSRQFKAKEIISEFEFSLMGELDLLREAASASQLKRNFQHSKYLYIPKIYWEYTRHDILVMEYVTGIPIRDKEKLLSHSIDLKKLAERGVEIFFTQAFRDSFFHADMHAGNLFVSTKNPSDPQIIAVDFGIMGTLNDRDQRYIAENFLAFFKRDYKRVAILHVESGWAPKHTRVDQLEMAIRTVCEPIFEKPLGEISFGQLLLQLFTMAQEFNIQIQPQLVLLQKTLLSVEGLARDLYPALDLWSTAKPFLEKWIKTQVGPKAFLRKVKEYGPLWLEQMPEIPNFIYRLLENMKQNSKKTQC